MERRSWNRPGLPRWLWSVALAKGPAWTGRWARIPADNADPACPEFLRLDPRGRDRGRTRWIQYPRDFSDAKIVLLFMMLWFGLALFIAISESIAVLAAPRNWSPGPPPIFFPLLFPVFGIVIVVAGRLLATWQERRLLAQLEAVFGIGPLSKV